MADFKEILDYCSETVTRTKPRAEFLKEVKEEKKKFQRSAAVFNDPIHGSIEVNSLELAIINSPEFSRLKDIKQLGGKFHVFHGATHTRFQHSIGVCHLAGEFVQHLNSQENDRKIFEEETSISPEEERCVRLAGLCHDLGHGPFSHIFETVTEKITEDEEAHHEKLSKLIFKKILLDNPKVFVMFAVECKMTVKHVMMIEKMISPNDPPKNLEDPQKKKFLYEIVANKESGMDVDKWDYFARDFLHLGVTSEFDWRRCVKMSSIVDVSGEYHIGFREKEVTNIYGMFRTRVILYFKALRHKTVEAVEMMLKDIFIFARCMKYVTVNGVTTSLEDALRLAFKSEKADLNGYLALTDSFLHLIRHSPAPLLASKSTQTEPVLSSSVPSESSQASESPVLSSNEAPNLRKAQELIDRLGRRELYKMIDEKTIISQGVYDKEKPEQESDMKELVHQMTELIKARNKEMNDGEIKLVCFKLSSEKALNPIEAMYFFQKQKEEDLRLIPRGVRESDVVMPASPLCKPEKFLEYRIRLYVKKNDTKDADLKKSFEDCFGEIEKMTLSYLSQ